uniref:ferredoxin:thioredoxin reductase n=1 Tax=Fundidesulfovibrio putealis TaxID=270496 RepID=A0A7C4AGH7_9BACT
MNASELYEKLKGFQEKKGYFFNKDTRMVMELLEMLLVNKERYGHMACPCRLASGVFEMDRDIICPCVYREEDVKEYGTCFCGLYASKEWNEGGMPVRVVPERRPAEKVLAGLGLD